MGALPIGHISGNIIKLYTKHYLNELLQILHTMFLVFSIIDSKYLNWMFSIYSPRGAYILVNILFLSGAGILYYGVLNVRSIQYFSLFIIFFSCLQFQANYVLGWIAYMIVIWQIPFVLLIVNIIFIQIRTNSGYFQFNIFMLPSLWLGKF